MTDLSNRIAAGLKQPGVTSTELSQLIEEAEAEQLRASSARDGARARARDPLTPADEASNAHADEVEQAFVAERMAMSVERLKQKHELALVCEREQARKAEVAEIESERDQLVEELRERYPRLAQELADLLQRVTANNERCLKHHLPLVEYRARGLSPSDVNFLTATVRLPAFEGRAHAMGERVWPPSTDHIGNVLPDHVVEAMRRAGEESRKTTEAGRALRTANEGRSTKKAAGVSV